MRLAEGIRSHINMCNNIAGFLEGFNGYDHDWSMEIEMLEGLATEYERELKDTVEGDFWLKGPISELQPIKERSQ